MSNDPRAYVDERVELGPQLITVEIGKGEARFFIHEAVLINACPFFEAATKKEWKEGQERVIRLPADTVPVFELYTQWLYRGKILSKDTSPEGDSKNEMGLLIDAFVFGEKIQHGTFKDALTDALVAASAESRAFPPKDQVDRAYRNTPLGSPIRDLLVDSHIDYASDESLADGGNAEFLTDLTRSLFSDRQRPYSSQSMASRAGRCFYHHHKDEQPCYIRKRGKTRASR